MNNPSQPDTIIALCTPRGPGALALIRISGKQAIEISEKFIFFNNKIKLSDKLSHTIHYGSIKTQDQSVIDHIMCIVMHAPHTFTGENTIEITCHNNPFIIQTIIETALFYGARPAQAGEFSKQAVLNGKMDVMQAEAINDLITANNQNAIKQALSQIKGSLSQQITGLQQELITILSLCQASFEFIDEENNPLDQRIKDTMNTIMQRVNILARNTHTQKYTRSGIKIALLGKVNAGKSSLFNMLIQQNKAIVTPIPGTTRDYIEAGVYHDGFYITFIDTAGIRTTTDPIEQEGIKHSFAQAEQADIILLVQEYTNNQLNNDFYIDILKKYSSKIIPIISKSDLCVELIGKNDSFIYCSTRNNNGIETLKETISQKIANLINEQKATFLLNTRQSEIIKTLEKKLYFIIDFTNKSIIPYEIVMYHLEEAIILFEQLTGKSINEAAMDKVFKDFCVGK